MVSEYYYEIDYTINSKDFSFSPFFKAFSVSLVALSNKVLEYDEAVDSFNDNLLCNSYINYIIILIIYK